MGFFELFRAIYRALPGSTATKRRLKTAWLRMFHPARLDTIVREMNLPYRGDPAAPDLRDRARKQWRVAAEAELDTFLANGELIAFPEAQEPRVSVLVVVYNEPGLTLQCLRSLAAETDEQVEVVLVDNGSDERTRTMLSRIEGAQIIYNDTNRHYIEGVNCARDQLRGDYLLLLNNDATLERGALKYALETASMDHAIAAVGAQVLSIDRLLLERGCEILANGRCRALQRGELPMDPSASDPTVDVDYVSGCFLLTPRDIFEQLGGLDSGYAPAYMDDADYCTALWTQGYRVVVDLRAKVTHFESAGSDDEQIARLVERNRRRFRRKFNWRRNHQARNEATS